MRKIEFINNENVYYQINYKYQTKWIEAKVLKRISYCVYLISVNGSTRTAHINQLRKKYSKTVTFAKEKHFLNYDNSETITEEIEESEESEESDYSTAEENSENENISTSDIILRGRTIKGGRKRKK